MKRTKRKEETRLAHIEQMEKTRVCVGESIKIYPSAIK